MNYVFKRLKFLNNRMVSQTATLAFLAVWHGWHAGYYVTFFNEFIVISFEKDFSTVWNKSVRVARWKEHPAYATVTATIGWCYVLFFLPHCFRLPTSWMEPLLAGLSGPLLHHLPLLHGLPCMGQTRSFMAPFKQPSKGGKGYQCCERGVMPLRK